MWFIILHLIPSKEKKNDSGLNAPIVPEGTRRPVFTPNVYTAIFSSVNNDLRAAYIPDAQRPRAEGDGTAFDATTTTTLHLYNHY